MTQTIALTELTTAPSLPPMASIAVRFAAVLLKWDTRRHTRKALAQLEVWQLDDVGLTRAAALTEARQPFWRD